MRLADWFAVARPRLAPPLFTAGATERLLRAASHFHADLCCILETRLGREGGPVDLSLAVSRPDQALELATLPFPLHVASLLRRWAEGDAPLRSLTALWLELDLPGALPDDRSIPAPVFCGRVAPDTAPETLVDTVLPALHGRPLRSEQRRLVLRLLSALPPAAQPLYLFSLREREPAAVRLEIFSPDAGFVPGYLALVAPELLPAARQALPWFTGIERIHLSLDVPDSGGTLLPRLGIEGSLPRQPQRDGRWKTLLDRLVAAGLCATERRDAALAWPGVDSIWTAAGSWPAGEEALALRCVRGLSHVKVTCGATEILEAKIYLTLGAFAPSPAGSAESSRASVSVRST